MQKLLFVLLALLAAMLPVYAEEPPALINWFKPPAWLLDQHPARADSTVLIRATVNGEEGTQILLAEDWAAVLWPTRSLEIFDYRLRTIVSSGSHAQMTAKPLGQEPMLSLDEMRNRTATTAKVDPCVVETLFRVEVPNGPFHGDARLERGEHSLSVVCGGRPFQSLELSANPEAPATLWPTLANVMHLHPRLAAELSALKFAPQTISSLNRDGQLEAEYRLEGAWPYSMAYNLTTRQFRASAHWTFMEDEVVTFVGEFTADKVVPGEPPAPPRSFKFGVIGEIPAEKLPELIYLIRSGPQNPSRWMDLSDYYVAHDDPRAALALASIAYNLPGGPRSRGSRCGWSGCRLPRERRRTSS